MEEVPKLVGRLGYRLARRILAPDNPAAFSGWLSDERPVPPLTDKRSRVANQMCGVLGGVLDRGELRDWWRAKTSTFGGGTPADAVSQPRRDEDFDALLDAADRYGARSDMFVHPDDKPPVPRGERREQEGLEWKPTEPVKDGRGPTRQDRR